MDDAPTIVVTPESRQAGWKDLIITSNAAGNAVYVIAPTVLSARAARPADPSIQVNKLGYLGNTGTSLQPDTVAILGFSGGKLYLAPFSQPGNAATQMGWREVWVDPVSSSRGTITVSDVDNQSVISIRGAINSQGKPEDGQFGDTTVVDLSYGNAFFQYRRTSFWSQAAYSEEIGGGDGFSGQPVYTPAKLGPDDAFMLEIKQTGTSAQRTVTTYEKVIVSGAALNEPQNDDGYLRLVDGYFPPPANPYPYSESGAPIVLDLDDNGFRFVGVQDSSAFYDLAGDGVRRATAWTSGQDALLAFDANNDGRISGKAEISFKDYLPGAATDLAGLVAFDTNADGLLSSADAQWGKFRVWQDKNEDGVQSADELTTLAQRGIASIGLTSNNVVSSASGVTVHGVGSYTRIDGTQARLADVQFAYTSETLSSVSNDTVDLSVNPVAQLSTGGGNDVITGSANADKIDAGTGDDDVMAGGGDDVVIGGAGNDQISGGDGADTLWGGNGNDKLLGDAGDDVLYGGSGDDYLGGGSGDDQLWGGTGNDVMSGGAGINTYHFAMGDGNDLIRDAGTNGLRIVLGTNSLGQNINPQNIQAEALEGGRGYVLRFSATDSLTIQNMGSAQFTSNTVQMTLADGSSVSMAQLLAATHVNHAPTLAAGLTRQTARQASPWTYTVPVGTFTDVDAGDYLSLKATLANGDALPIWLGFNATTRTFSGTPPTTSAGEVSIKVVATDAFGLRVATSFNVDIQTVGNRAPTVANAPVQTTVNEDSAWTFTVPNNTFTDPDAGDTLSLSATLANGDALPTWLSFNAATKTFSGTPLNANVGTLAIKVVATDALGLSVSSTFDVQVANTNDAPTVANALTQKTVNEDSVWTFTVPTNTFADPDVGDTLSLSATLANGAPLPTWLSFDAATKTFSGTPLNANVGTLAIKVVATDALGLSVSSTFDVQVANTNDAPTVNAVLTNQRAVSGQAFSYVLPTAGATAAFIDQDVGDVLSLSAKLADGSMLPSWLSFNAATATFSGVPTSTSVGSLNVRVTAADAAGASVSNAFALEVQAPAYTGGTTPPPGALVGTPGKDVLTASSAYTEVWGLGDNDIINGFWGSTILVGGAGNDTINAVGGAANILDGGDGNDVLTGASGNDTLIGGEGNNTIKVTGGSAIVTAGSGNDTITALWGDDKIDAGGGNNDINAGGGNNNILAGTGNDKVVADWGDDVINVGDGNNSVAAGEGRNVIVSGEGNDTIGAMGVNVVMAGAGNDKITLGWGNDWVQAGKGNDVIDAGGGANLFAFNKGDGADTVVNSFWGADTISLGGGIKYADLMLSKSGNDLVLRGTGSDRITLKDWYASSQNHGIGKLQVLTAGGDFNATSASTLANKAVTVFDFDKLVKAFDAARAATSGATAGWAVAGSLGNAQLHTTAPIASGYVNPWAALQAGTALLDKAPTAAINPISTSPVLSVDQLLFAALNGAGNTNRAAGWMQA